MDPDHRWELQLGGPDVASNLQMMDWFTNRRIAINIWNQIKDLEVGTKIKIKIER